MNISLESIYKTLETLTAVCSSFFILAMVVLLFVGCGGDRDEQVSQPPEDVEQEISQFSLEPPVVRIVAEITDPALMNDTEDERYDLKLSWQMNNSHRLDVKYGKDKTFHPWNYDANVWAPSTWKYRTRDNQIINGEYSGILSANTFLQIRVGTWTGDNGDLPTDLANRDIIYVHDFDGTPNTGWGGPYWDWIWVQDHDQVDVVLSQFASDFAGDHEFKFGVQYNSGGGDTKTFDPDYHY